MRRTLLLASALLPACASIEGSSFTKPGFEAMSIERIAVVAPSAGDYSLEVSTGSNRPAGRYALTVVVAASA